MDETFERILVDFNGRSSVFIDGQARHPLGARSQDRQVRAARATSATRTCSTSIRRPARRPIGPNMIPQAGVELEFCPSSSGFKSLRAMAYHPETQAFYIPLNLHLREGHVHRQSSASRAAAAPVAAAAQNLMHPESPDGIGEFLAMTSEDGRDPLAPSHAHAAEHRGADHRRRAGRRRRLGSLPLRPRCDDRQDPVSDAPVDVGARAIRSRTRSTAGSTSRCRSAPAAGRWVTSIPIDLSPEKKIAPSGNAIFVFALP